MERDYTQVLSTHKATLQPKSCNCCFFLFFILLYSNLSSVGKGTRKASVKIALTMYSAATSRADLERFISVLDAFKGILFILFF